MFEMPGPSIKGGQTTLRERVLEPTQEECENRQTYRQTNRQIHVYRHTDGCIDK